MKEGPLWMSWREKRAEDTGPRSRSRKWATYGLNAQPRTVAGMRRSLWVSASNPVNWQYPPHDGWRGRSPAKVGELQALGGADAPD